MKGYNQVLSSYQFRALGPTSRSDVDAIGWRGGIAAGRSLLLAFIVSVLPAHLYAQASIAFDDEGAIALNPRAAAVIPFINVSGQTSDDWIGVGIAESVAADLEQLGSVSIVGREIFLDRGLSSEDETAAVELSRDLGVSWIVSGGYQRLGDQLRITVRVVDVETGEVSKSVKVDGTIDELFSLQDRIVPELNRDSSLFDNPPASRSMAVPVPPESARIALPSGRQTRRALGTFAPGAEGDAPLPEAATSVPPERYGALVGRPPKVDTTRPAGITLDEMTGEVIFERTEPQFGIASGAGILTGRPMVRPPRTSVSPTIDGRLDDTIWQSAAKITEFVQSQPLDGAPATEDTEVYIAYDSVNLYFGFYLHYSDPSVMRANRVDRDRANMDDLISVYFDTFLDQQRAYAFSVNGYGVQGDQLINSRGGGGFGGRGGGGHGGGGGAPRGDRSWDVLYETGSQIVEDGFTAEMAIPFKSLRYPQRDDDFPHRWGFQIVREIKGKDNETAVWAPISRDIAGFLPQMGVLGGLTSLSTSRNFEILPTFTAINFGSLNDTTGRFNVQDTSPEGGINFKYGLTSNLTADLTLNPDFSQIESDRPQIEVNQRFARYYPELRPFFLEGAEIFSIQAPVTFVHTRTIVDPLYGAKLTGKIGKTTVGLLYTNDEAPGNVDDVSDPAFGQTSQTFIGRVLYDLYSESHIGAIVTSRDFLDSHSRLGGLDANLRLGQTHSIGIRAVGTERRDLDGTDSTGHMLNLNLRKSGRILSYFVSGLALSPDFKTDVGFVRRVDQRRAQGRTSYTWWPQHWLISWGPSFGYGRNWNFDGVLEDENRRMGLNLNFARNIRFNLDMESDMERFGGINFEKTRGGIGGNINTNQNIGFGGGFNWGDEVYFDSDNPFLGSENGLYASINLRPMPAFRTRLNINTSRFTDLRPGGTKGFDVKIFRAESTYQFTDRLLVRNISEYNTFDKTVGVNLLATYRVNAGTVLFLGYDDHYQQAERFFGDNVDVNGDGVADPFYTPDAFKQTNRAFFLKFQYLFRY